MDAARMFDGLIVHSSLNALFVLLIALIEHSQRTSYLWGVAIKSVGRTFWLNKLLEFYSEL